MWHGPPLLPAAWRGEATALADARPGGVHRWEGGGGELRWEWRGQSLCELMTKTLLYTEPLPFSYCQLHLGPEHQHIHTTLEICLCQDALIVRSMYRCIDYNQVSPNLDWCLCVPLTRWTYDRAGQNIFCLGFLRLTWAGQGQSCVCVCECACEWQCAACIP